jgi:Flp pilus assembly protein TadD
VARIAASAALAILAAAALTRASVWKDPLILWTEAVQRAPGSWQAHVELGGALNEIGQCDRAQQEYSVAVRLNPTLTPELRGAWRPSCSQGRVQR